MGTNNFPTKSNKNSYKHFSLCKSIVCVALETICMKNHSRERAKFSAIVFYSFYPKNTFTVFFCVHRFDKNQRRCQGTGAGRTFVENALETHKSFQYINHASKCIRQKCLQMAMLKLWEVFLFFLFSWPMDDQMTVHRINGDAIWWSRRKMLFLIICNWIVAEGFEEKHKHSTQWNTFCIQVNPIFLSFVCLQSFTFCLSHLAQWFTWNWTKFLFAIVKFPFIRSVSLSEKDVKLTFTFLVHCICIIEL